MCQPVLIVGLSLVCSYVITLQTLAVEHAAVREAWRKRLDEHDAVVYQATAVKLTLGEERAADATGEVGIVALLRCDQRKFRFDLKAEKDRFPALHILDGGGFHTCVQTLPSKWEATTTRSISEDSPWLNLYPFLLAHGVAPLPPFEAPQIAGKKRQGAAPGGSVAGQRVTFEFAEKEPLSVAVAHGSHGLIERYEVTKNGRKLLEVRNTYRRDERALRLDGFSVMRFDSHGRLAAQLDGRVKACQLDATIPSEAFARPRAPDELRADLLQALSKTALVPPEMSLADLAQSVQKTMGNGVQVRIDAEAFKKGPKAGAVNVDRLQFKPGEATLSQFLLRDLRPNRVDFYLDAQGIVLIPRNEAWNYAGFANYSAKDYGVSAGELRDLIFKAATPDDWSDLGGQATILADKDGQTLMVLHTQSDHLRFEERLRKGGD